VESQEHHARSPIRPLERLLSRERESPRAGRRVKRVGTSIEDAFRLDDLGDGQEPEALPPGRRSDRLFFEELFFAVD
jgi:hypothetical protein